jgi:hypothetical protein
MGVKVCCCGLHTYTPAPLVLMFITTIARDFPHSVHTNVWISFVPVYQNVVDLIVNISIRRGPSKFINVAMCKHCTLDN